MPCLVAISLTGMNSPELCCARSTITRSNIEDSKWGIQETGVDFAKSRIADSSYSENEIVIGVFDSGVNYEHNLLKDKITDTSFNMSDSGNENDCMDDNGHGTSVAGIIAQATPDNVKIKPYKVMNDKGRCIRQ